MLLTIDVCRARYPGGGQAFAYACQSGNKAMLLTSLLFVFEISFLLKYRTCQLLCLYYKVVLCDIM